MTKPVRLILLFTALLTGITAWASSDSELAEAAALARQGDQEGAIRAYQAIKEQYADQKPERLARIALGNLFLEKRDITAAKNEFFTVVHRFPKSDQTNEALFGLARAEFANQRHKAVRLLLEKLPSPVMETMPQQAVQILTLSYRNALALEDKPGALLALDGLVTLGSRENSGDQTAKLLPHAKAIVNALNRRGELEALLEKARSDDVRNLLSARLGDSPRAPAAVSTRAKFSARDSSETRLWLATGLAMLSSVSQDRASGAQANLASTLSPAFRLNFALGLSKSWEIFTAVDAALVSLLAPSNRTLVGASQLDLDLGLGLRAYFGETQRVSVALEMGLAREVLLRSTGLTELTVDNVFLPKLSLQGGAEIAQWPKGGLGIEGELGYLLGKSTDTQTVSSGIQFLGRLYTRFLLGQSSQLKIGLYLAESRLSTAFELRNNDSLGLQAGVGFRL